MRWYEEGNDPDYRFSLANERTFLAWIRTSLAILAGAIVMHQLGLDIGPAWISRTLSGGLALLAGALGIGAYVRWRDNEIAMRHSHSLPHSVLIPMLAISAGVLGIASLIVMLIE